jgi:hypothetical protein
MEVKNIRTIKLGELSDPFDSNEDIRLETGAASIRLPGPLTARKGPQNSYFFQFRGEGLRYKGVSFRGTVQVGEDGTVTGNLAEGLSLDPSGEGARLRSGSEVMISEKGVLQSKDTYLIEGDCNAKKCALSRDLAQDPL